MGIKPFSQLPQVCGVFDDGCRYPAGYVAWQEETEIKQIASVEDEESVYLFFDAVYGMSEGREPVRCDRGVSRQVWLKASGTQAGTDTGAFLLCWMDRHLRILVEDNWRQKLEEMERVVWLAERE